MPPGSQASHSDWIEKLTTRLLPLEAARSPVAVEPELFNLGRAPPDQEPKPVRAAAVLVPVVLRPENLTVLLTLRAEHLTAHAGQVAFPGGRIEPDDHSPIETALREAEEEIGLLRTYVSPIGALAPFLTGTGFRIRPIVGLVSPGFSLMADPNEVAEIFEMPLKHLMDRANHERRSAVFQGEAHEYFVIPGAPHQIWGATAGIIVNMCDQLFGKGSGS